MQKLFIRLVTGLFLLLSWQIASAHEYKVGNLEIVHPNTRAMIPGAKVGGGWMQIINHGTEDDRLVSATAERANVVQLHEMAIVNDVMKMREIAGGIIIPAGQTVELKKGGLHVMFMDVTDPYKEGETIKGTLVFEKAGSVDVEFAVGPMAGEAGHDMNNMKHDHKMEMDGKGASGMKSQSKDGDQAGAGN